MAIAECDKRQIDHQYQEWQRDPQDIREQHRNAGGTAVDEMTRLEETVNPHSGGQDSQNDEKRVCELTKGKFHPVENNRWCVEQQPGSRDSLSQQIAGSAP